MLQVLGRYRGEPYSACALGLLISGRHAPNGKSFSFVSALIRCGAKLLGTLFAQAGRADGFGPRPLSGEPLVGNALSACWSQKDARQTERRVRFLTLPGQAIEELRAWPKEPDTKHDEIRCASSVHRSSTELTP
jgi:hypothetical protein